MALPWPWQWTLGESHTVCSAAWGRTEILAAMSWGSNPGFALRSCVTLGCCEQSMSRSDPHTHPEKCSSSASSPSFCVHCYSSCLGWAMGEKAMSNGPPSAWGRESGTKAEPMLETGPPCWQRRHSPGLTAWGSLTVPDQKAAGPRACPGLPRLVKDCPSHPGCWGNRHRPSQPPPDFPSATGRKIKRHFQLSASC